MLLIDFPLPVCVCGCAGCSLLSWKHGAPLAELSIQMLMCVVAVALLPIFFCCAVFRVGLYRIPLRCSVMKCDAMRCAEVDYLSHSFYGVIIFWLTDSSKPCSGEAITNRRIASLFSNSPY